MSGVHSRGTSGSNCDQLMREPPGLAACSCRPAPSPPARRPALTLEGRLNKTTASVSMSRRDFVVTLPVVLQASISRSRGCVLHPPPTMAAISR